MLVQYFVFSVAVGVFTWVKCTRLAHEGDPKFSELLKNVSKIFVKVSNFIPSRSTPLVTG